MSYLADRQPDKSAAKSHMLRVLMHSQYEIYYAKSNLRLFWAEFGKSNEIFLPDLIGPGRIHKIQLSLNIRINILQSESVTSAQSLIR